MPDDIQSFAIAVLRKLDQGVPLDWTDIRIYLVIGFAAIIGSAFGGYISTYFKKRGEIAAIRKDLDKITQIQEEIKASISTRAWIDQNWWTLKRDIYWKVIQTLHNLSDACWNLLQFGFYPDKSNIDPTQDTLGQQVEKAIDEYIKLTGIAHIVFPEEVVSVIKDCSLKIRDINRNLHDRKGTYEYYESIRRAFDEACNRIINLARDDLKGKTTRLV